MLLSFVLAIPPIIFGATPAPSPQASGLPTIVHITVRPLCTELHTMVLPFAKTESQNNVAFKKMDKQLGDYKQWDMETLSDTGQTGTFTANGAHLLRAGQIDQEATNVMQALADRQKELDRSYRQIPIGRDPALDTIRARMSNIIKLQYAVAARYDEVAGKALDQIGLMPLNADDTAGGNNGPSDFNEVDPAVAQTPIPPGQLPPPNGSDTPVAHQFLIDAPANEVVKGMVVQEFGFVKPALQAVNTCDPPPKK